MAPDDASSWIERARDFSLSAFGSRVHGERYNRGLFWAKARALASALRSEPLPPPRTRRCLDAGIGHGWLLEAWRRQGVRHLAGLDLSAETVARARARHPDARLRTTRLEDWTPDPGEAHDLVCALDVLFYLTDDAVFDRAVGALGRAVAPGGLFLASDAFGNRPFGSPTTRSRPLAAYTQALGPGFRLRRVRNFFVAANFPVPPEAGGKPWQAAAFRGADWLVWNLSRARNPLARPLETAAVAGLYGLDALLLAGGGRWRSQGIAVWKREVDA